MSLLSFVKVIEHHEEMPAGYSMTGQNSLVPNGVALDFSQSFKSKKKSDYASDNDSYDDIPRKKKNSSKLYRTMGSMEANSKKTPSTNPRGYKKGK